MHVTEIQVKQIIFHYIIFNSTVHFSHYNMPAFTRRPVYAKARLCEAYTNGEDFVEIARILKVKRVTAYTIISRLNRVSSMSDGGHRYQKVDDEMRACAVDVISENPIYYTLQQINEELQRRLPEKPEASLKTLSNCLEGIAYTLKLSRAVPSDRNRMDVKTDRQNYASWLMSEEVVNNLKVFVDEFGVNFHTKSFGRSTRGTRAYRTVSGQAGANVTVCLGVCATHGLVFYEIYRGGMTIIRFSSFLEHWCRNVITENAAHRLGFVILDNAPAHRNLENLDVELLNLKRLPKYSSLLIQRRMPFRAGKQSSKSKHLNVFIDISDEMRNSRTLNEYRFEKVRDILEISKGVIIPEKCRAWENNVLTYLPRCLAFDNIEE